jgi:hypothetical protein
VDIRKRRATYSGLAGYWTAMEILGEKVGNIECQSAEKQVVSQVEQLPAQAGQ